MLKQIDKAIVINWKVTIREQEGNEHHFHTLLFKQIVNVMSIILFIWFILIFFILAGTRFITKHLVYINIFLF